MTKYITEILAELNTDPKKLVYYKENYAIRTILNYAYIPELKFILPEGTPPFKPSIEPIGMTPSNFYGQMRKLYIFTRRDISKVRREQLFVQLLECIHPTEAAVILAVKDQNLTSLYPNLTREVLEGVGFIKPLPFQSTEQTNDGGKQLVLNIDEDDVEVTEKFGGPTAKPVEPVVEAPKKRGRPKKAVEVETALAPKKRGRPRKDTK